MNGPTGKSSIKTVAETIDRKPIVSPLTKAFQKINGTDSKKSFGILDRRTLEICACYKDSVKFSFLALIGTFIGVVII